MCKVFMTSHSIEAISKSSQVLSRYEKWHTDDNTCRYQEGIKIRNVNATKAIQLMDDYGLELR